MIRYHMCIHDLNKCLHMWRVIVRHSTCGKPNSPGGDMWIQNYDMWFMCAPHAHSFCTYIHMFRYLYMHMWGVLHVCISCGYNFAQFVHTLPYILTRLRQVCAHVTRNSTCHATCGMPSSPGGVMWIQNDDMWSMCAPHAQSFCTCIHMFRY